jgi:hypothetical protein
VTRSVGVEPLDALEPLIEPLMLPPAEPLVLAPGEPPFESFGDVLLPVGELPPLRVELPALFELEEPDERCDNAEPGIVPVTSTRWFTCRDKSVPVPAVSETSMPPLLVAPVDPVDPAEAEAPDEPEDPEELDEPEGVCDVADPFDVPPVTT